MSSAEIPVAPSRLILTCDEHPTTYLSAPTTKYRNTTLNQTLMKGLKLTTLRMSIPNKFASEPSTSPSPSPSPILPPSILSACNISVTGSTDLSNYICVNGVIVFNSSVILPPSAYIHRFSMTLAELILMLFRRQCEHFLTNRDFGKP